MARKVIDVGAVGNDGTGDSIRASFTKVNDNFRELYSSLGLGERLTFIGLDDTPATFLGQEGAVLTVNETTDGVKFKQITGGVGVTIDDTSNPNEIIVSTEFSEISGDQSPQLGGDLSVRSGGNQYRIKDLVIPISDDEASNKEYVDTKISRAGVNAIDPETGAVNSAFGRMSGPLILSRSPSPDDDELYGGLIAATKQYVDSSSFGSSVNLYVATSGSDERPGVSDDLQGRALAYAYRSIEAALKRAEEILLESNDDIGPYKKLLTYNNGGGIVILNAVETSPDSGAGFSGTPTLSVDTISLANGGTNYRAGDVIEIAGGTGDAARYEVLTTVTTPGAVLTFRQLSSGNYTALPGSTGVTSTTDSAFGAGATFNITYKVNGVSIVSGGSGYSLVSIRITGGGETRGAFGVATVVAGEITSVEITDEGTGFTTVPNVVGDLPRFLLKTEGYRTDFTGDVLTDTPVAFRTRDIREGLYLRGEESGALAQILAHEGALDSLGNEIFDVDIKYGNFQIGEPIAYGDITNQTQITVLVESGIYEENLPLKVPQNVSVVGDEFRRCIVKPKPGTSSSPWAFIKFRRDPVIDGMQVTDRLFGYHYLQDTGQPVYPKINNGGGRKSAAQLIKLNKVFIQNEVIGWINYQIVNNIAPFTTTFSYNESLCKRDVGLIVDAMVFDIKWGEYNRTISAGLKYYQNASGRLAITTQKSETILGIQRVEYLVNNIINNILISDTYQEVFPQIRDNAYVKESGSEAIVTALVAALVDVIDGSGSVNYPKENDQMDVFMANDAVRWQGLTMQGHGGFSLVLDPTGQILAKSPYAQECASFSKSINRQTFAGGMFVDGFAGNLQFLHSETIAGTGNTRLKVDGLDRVPQLPASFIVDDTVYRINYVRDFVYNPAGSSATFVLDETTPFTKTPGPITIDSVTVASIGIINKSNHGLQADSIIKFTSTGTLPGGIEAGREYFVMENGLTVNTFRISTDFTSSAVPVEITSSGSGTIKYQRSYEVLMPGNRSMLSNDFTQVADMGYGLIATNGGLTEAVSMFTYYCYVSYYSLNGAQIRSVSGSSSHGVYGLVAEGSDPLEVPTPVTMYYDLAQRVDCYYPTAQYANTANGLFVYVTNYDYVPLNNSELEVDHGNLIYRYPVTSVSTQDLPAGVARLNLTSDTTGNFEGLYDAIPDGTKMSLRSNSQIVLTGDIVEVATRPSTGLRLQESTDVYRVLQFEDYVDSRGLSEVEFTAADPAKVTFLITVTDISGNELFTTSRTHGLRTGDFFVPKTSDNGLTASTVYYIESTPNYNQFTLAATSGGPKLTSFVDGTGLNLKGKIPHKQQRNYLLSFESTGDLPTGILEGQKYYVLEEDLTNIDFKIDIAPTLSGVATTTTGTGTISGIVEGLGKTTLRENYNYIDLTIYKPGEYVTSASSCTLTVAAPCVVTAVGHGLTSGDVIRFDTDGTLPTGLNNQSHFFVFAVLDPDTFQISVEHPSLGAAIALETSGSQSGNHTFGLVTGRAGDSAFAVVPVAPQERARVAGSKIIFNGEEYIITTYQSEDDLSEPWARITLNRPLVDSVIAYGATYTIRSAVPIRTTGAEGNLTIRISLTRVTGHDLLEVGTGSYADTNYPNEIYGPPVNALNQDTETDERDVGRVFYVTTDQFGNFRVGPYFSVDQGTGQVTFSAAIALSNLDGIGFKRGVPIAEFSTDSGMTDNAVDTVPTENATRLYIERRLGTTHSGAPVEQAQLIPPLSGGFMPLDGSLNMKNDMDLGNNKIINVADPVNPNDAANLAAIRFDNLSDFTFTDLQANQILVFTGSERDAINATVQGDITFNIDSTANTIDAQIEPDTIINADVNSAAGIEQSKLTMQLATTAALAPTGAAEVLQAASGIASFDDAQFTISNGWVTIKNNGVAKSKLAQIAAKSVLGNNGLSSANAADVTMSTVVDSGGGIKKSQYNVTGLLRRINSGSNANDVDYTVIETSASYSGTADNNKLINRDSNGDFGARVADLSQLNIDGIEAIDTGSLSGSSGYIRVHTYGTNGGIYLNDGTLASDKRTEYWNDSHIFKTQNGLANAPITASQVQTLSLTTGGNTTSGTITGRWTLTGTSPNESRLEATYSADVAEYYEGDKEYEVGTVLVFGGDKEVTTTNKNSDTRVAGVVSNTAAYVMYAACPGLKNLVALTGRVPCKVVGKIKKGDILVTAGIHGVATVTTDPKAGTIVGKAIEDYDSDHIGTIQVAVGRS